MFKFFSKGNKQAPQTGSSATPVTIASSPTVPVASQPQPQATPVNTQQVAAANVEHHKAVIAHFNQLLTLGYDAATVQAQWQQYYDQLGNNDKTLVNQLMSSVQSSAAPSPLSPVAPSDIEVAQALLEDNEPVAAKPITAQVDYNNYQETDSVSDDARSLNRFFGGSVALKKYNAFQSLTKKKKVIPSSMTAATLSVPAVPVPGGTLIPVAPVVTPPNVARPVQSPLAPPPPPPKMSAKSVSKPTKTVVDAGLGQKAQNMMYWNSNTALFDQQESKSIMHQNYKSILFGLTFGVLMVILWQFTFINERFIQPFIKPSSASDVQILISPEVREVQDPTFRLMLPTTNVNAVVYDTLEPRDADENFSDFEKRVQAALLQGVLHYPTSYTPGQSGKGFKTNIVIMGHSSGNALTNRDPRSQKYKFIFKSLRDLEVNHQIVIWHNQTEYIYQIYDKLIVNPNQVEVLRSGSENKHLKYNSTLTLLTCEPPGTINQRMVILARQIIPALDENQEVEEGDNAEDEDFVPGKTPSWLN